MLVAEHARHGTQTCNHCGAGDVTAPQRRRSDLSRIRIHEPRSVLRLLARAAENRRHGGPRRLSRDIVVTRSRSHQPRRVSRSHYRSVSTPAIHDARDDG
jgi:hypothetical protein